MSHRSPARDRGPAFTALYGGLHTDLVRSLQRRAHPHEADDVVADAFLVVWRRLEESPRCHDDARAWVFGTTRNILLHRQRGEQRRHALGVRLADLTELTRPDPDAELVLSPGRSGRPCARGSTSRPSVEA